MTPLKVFVGWDASEDRAWNVATHSLRRHARVELDIHAISMANLRYRKLYRRPTQEVATGGYWDAISEAPMSTGHAIARFLVPKLCDYRGWALFCDGDVMFRADVADLFVLADPQYAVQVVKHQYAPLDTVKKDGHAQTSYQRKNWSSVCLWNCEHPANRALTVLLVNTVPGRDLHRFCWLDDVLIGSVPARWNVLVNHSPYDEQAALVHFTEGLPDVAGYEHQPYAAEWYERARGAGIAITQPVEKVPA